MDDIRCELYQARTDISEKVSFLQQVRAIAEKYGTHIILFDADRMAGEEHVRSALRHAWRSYSEGTPIANSFEMEALLYAAGTRQCLLAANYGIRTGENRLYVGICPPSGGARDELATVLQFVDEDWETIDPDKAKRLQEIFGITPEELAVVGRGRIQDLVLERVALLEVYR
ncbi:hypothetical protein FGU65_08085 [Methanoculleus sp. FWC-SCC1]|uniref:Kinase binding protein CGI-121 n=1 Tax=Methanoculleus frigidifontis TaxID=2584085 RepID=A0ABT8MAB4_9EURY|nr:KEOPS complex subunit Cgi121 [Methanoculleus sp. FWC-SCC1]MDN7024845.1 hypothetical protein [Methanoculleus sp. FWC-SCC1]